MTQLVDAPVAVNHDCPQCYGVIPAEAICFGRSRRVTRRGYPYRRAKVTVTCPHCDFTGSKHVEYPES